MTAEIAALNREAVALSADSASTVQTGAGPKVFNSVSKIFGLTKSEPVGIMIYGQASFLDVPWETIVRAFRDKRDPAPLKHLADYGDEFIDFIQSWRAVFPAKAQKQHVASAVTDYFRYLEGQILGAIQTKIETEGSIKRGEIKSVLKETLAEHRETWKEAADTPGPLAGKTDEIRSKYAGAIKEARLSVFAQAPIDGGSARMLSDMASWLFTKRPPKGHHPDPSGVVIAGFGSEDYFPRLVSFAFEGMALNKVKYQVGTTVTIDRDADSAVIVPFAQRDNVVAFMEGIHPSARGVVLGELDRLLRSYPAEVLEEAGISAKTRTKVLDAFSKRQEPEWEQVLNRLADHIKRDHVRPVVEVVSVLPKDELALMAESLVSLTSFRHRVSFGAETVGGPIDVAVISKGDGFVWIKRKHYFKRELNPQFIAQKYGGAS
jgi:hypothetical protein